MELVISGYREREAVFGIMTLLKMQLKMNPIFYTNVIYSWIHLDAFNNETVQNNLMY